MLTLFAQSTNSAALPPGKAVAMIVFFGTVAVVSVVGLLASRRSLESMAGIIGTKNPLVARIVCGLGVLVGGFAVTASVLSLLGKF